jgi:hypothetical protein
MTTGSVRLWWVGEGDPFGVEVFAGGVGVVAGVDAEVVGGLVG